MSTPSRPFRIALLDALRQDSFYEFCRGVFEYKAHSPHWQMCGSTTLRAFSELDAIKPENVDGVIGWFPKPEAARKLADAGISVVTLSSRMRDPAIPRVCDDTDAIGRIGAQHLLESGFENYGFCTDRISARLTGLVAAFREVIEHSGRPCPVFTMARNHRPKERADFLRWLEAQPKPIAIMTSADILAKLVIDYATELDLSVPGDVAVLGVGNHQWLCTIRDIQISSVVPNHRQVGYRAAVLLDQLLKGQPCPPALRIPPIGVAARESTDIELTVDPLVTAALTYIRQNIAEPPSVAEIARHVAVSRRTLQMRMQKAVGYSPREAISNERLRVAKRLLIETGGTVQQVAFACGFSDQAHFSRFFKSHTTERPGEYRLRGQQR